MSETQNATMGSGRAHSASEIAEYRDAGWWGNQTLGQYIARHATVQPDGNAFVADDTRYSWAQYDHDATHLAILLSQLNLRRGSRVAIWLPDGPTVHVAFVAAERAGLVAVGIGARAGHKELGSLVQRTGALALITHCEHRGTQTAGIVEQLRREGATSLAHHLVMPQLGCESIEATTLDGRLTDISSDVHAPLEGAGIHPDEFSMINSTSGTTGLPKCVMHNQNRWHYFHQRAVMAGDLTASDVFCSVVPAPFGFGLWTSHYTPAYLGATCVIMERFDAAELLRKIEEERVTVLACVSTQFIMMLASPDLADRDLSSLRVMFTGGEAVPYERAAAFEDQTGATVLQFFGSNESGAFSQTMLTDDREVRLRSAGRLIDDMQVRLFDEEGLDVTATGRGRPAGRGPATCLGYWDDPAANDELFTDDGWLLMGDIVEIQDGLLRVVGRSSDFIIRGGKNISAARVEEEVCSIPAVAVAAAIPVPDQVFGERVCIVVELRDGHALTLDELIDELKARDVSSDLLPERLVIVDELPRSSGGKIAKGQLRDIDGLLSGSLSHGGSV